MTNRFAGWRWTLQPLFCLLVLPVGEAVASKPVFPKRRDLFSPNGRFVVDVRPVVERFTVYSATNRDQPLWSFRRPDPPTLDWWNDYFLSNDGKAVLIINGIRVNEDELDWIGVEFWTEQGLVKEFTIRELCPHPRSAPDDHRWVPPPRGKPWREEAGSDGEKVWLRTTDGYKCVFSLTDGTMLSRTRIIPRSTFALGGVGFLILGVAFGYLWRRKKVPPTPPAILNSRT